MVMEQTATMLGVILATVSFVLVLFGTPCVIYYIVRMGNHKNDGTESWHDLWGLNRNNLIFFPSRLNERGKAYRAKVLYWARLLVVGALAGVLAMVLLGKAF
jgi:hypothetical protein